jgi:hypothetical protein
MSDAVYRTTARALCGGALAVDQFAEWLDAATRKRLATTLSALDPPPPSSEGGPCPGGLCECVGGHAARRNCGRFRRWGCTYGLVERASTPPEGVVDPCGNCGVALSEHDLVTS